MNRRQQKNMNRKCWTAPAPLALQFVTSTLQHSPMSLASSLAPCSTFTRSVSIVSFLLSYALHLRDFPLHASFTLQISPILQCIRSDTPCIRSRPRGRTLGPETALFKYPGTNLHHLSTLELAIFHLANSSTLHQVSYLLCSPFCVLY